MSIEKNATIDAIISAAFPAPVNGQSFREGLRLIAEGARMYGASEKREEAEDKADRAYKRGVLDGREEMRVETELRASGRKPFPENGEAPAPAAAPVTDPQPTCERSWQIGYSRGKAEGELGAIALAKSRDENAALRKDLQYTVDRLNDVCEQNATQAAKFDSARTLANVIRNL